MNDGLAQHARQAEQISSFASLWSTTAEPGIAFPSLMGDAQADVAVVGAGYTGLSAALHLAERGASVIVLETQKPGWGASGRNGGQVIPDYPMPLVAPEPPAPSRVEQRLRSRTSDCLSIVQVSHAVSPSVRRLGPAPSAPSCPVRWAASVPSTWSPVGTRGREQESCPRRSWGRQFAGPPAGPSG